MTQVDQDEELLEQPAVPEAGPGAERVLLNRSQLARAFRVSKPTIDSWKEDGMPIEVHGSRGVEYQADPWKVYEWRLGIKRQEVEDAKRAEEVTRQLHAQLDLEGGTAHGADALSPKQRKAHYENEKLRIIVDKQRGELVRRALVESEFYATMIFLNRELQRLPDTLEERLQLEPEVVQAIIDEVDRWQSELAKRLKVENLTDGLNELTGDAAA